MNIDHYTQVNFKDKYFGPIISGLKVQTMRPADERWDVQEEDTVVANFPDRPQKVLLQITEIGHKKVKDIINHDALLEGFFSAEEVKQELSEIYKELNFTDLARVFYYRFEVIGLIERVEDIT